MKSTLEYKQQPAAFRELSTGAKVLRAEVRGFVVTVRKNELVTICAWCDPQRNLARKLKAAGYKPSHGICNKHRKEFAGKMNHCD